MAYVTVYPVENKVDLIRNPCMGWVLYIDAFEGGFPEARAYWALQQNNVAKASIFYVRLPWSIVEPHEGKYAWDEDPNFKLLIQMALERGLKLAFRVYVDSRNAFIQATPQYVFDAGAEGYANHEEHSSFLTPYLYDQVFQEKLTRFIEAFARQYDDPSIVDFIDAQGLGWWGEMHNVSYLTASQRKQVFEWITNVYSSNFKRVLLGAQYGENAFELPLQDWALREKGYMIRRDSFGSPIWFQEEHKDKIRSHWPNVPVFAENCYHGFAGRSEWYQGDGFATLRDMMAKVVSDAEELHANTLDLRYPEDATLWTETAPDLVQRFAVNGGYRLALSSIEYPEEAAAGEDYLISHVWKNSGVGIIPNRLRNWDYKYKPAFALLDEATHTPVLRIIDTAEPSDWFQGRSCSYRTPVSFEGVPAGKYFLAAAIVNRDNGFKPEIGLAIDNEKTSDGWYILGRLAVR
ncbi:hypothetical protein RB620_09625 [Paenibacillus sp. LHD-117]|uniref:hypothetical protein n=1 Tax=Paenibacillus sp. LHD-117 TaxID=3071412 RepID=UPI0027DFEE72|nr:hypothetical protein [Paenibacillus sp. LHD-117]MDQ6419689.1 hypothetical protein [Paenibacillus sp. LHD-117]